MQAQSINSLILFYIQRNKIFSYKKINIIIALKNIILIQSEVFFIN
jgi:hypothetical protein